MERHNLERYLSTQKAVYYTALSELQAGEKRSQWMWYIFPPLQGLAFSEASKQYAIKDLDEATMFLRHRVLGPRLVLISSALLKLQTNDASEVFGTTDKLKLHSSMTLFSEVPGSDPVFRAVLNKFFNGTKDNKTLEILGRVKQH